MLWSSSFRVGGDSVQRELQLARQRRREAGLAGAGRAVEQVPRRHGMPMSAYHCRRSKNFAGCPPPAAQWMSPSSTTESFVAAAWHPASRQPVPH